MTGKGIGKGLSPNREFAAIPVNSKEVWFGLKLRG